MLKHDKYFENTFCNVGDTFQDLAMDYIFSQIPIDEKDVRYLARDADYLNEPKLGKTMIPTYVHMFQNANARLPLPKEFTPVFISVVVYQDLLGEHPEIVAYLKKYEPVGCRDEQALQVMRKHGIEAYLMGCFTICFPKRTRPPQNGKVFFVDTPEEIDPFVPEEVRKKAEYITHAVPYAVYPVTVEEDMRQRKIAQEYLDRYAREAEMVVTSRLHAAVPCMAMGIPVILVRENYDFRFGWIEKYLKLYHLEELEHIDWHPSAVDVDKAKTHLMAYIRKSLLRLPGKKEHLIWLDRFYANREKATLNKMIYEKVNALAPLLKKEGTTYGIWGAGAHGKFVQQIIQEKYPKARLKVIVDKFVKGTLFNVPIITGDLFTGSVDHMFITTLPGKPEAISRMEEIYGSDAENRYTVITSRQIC